MFVDPREQKRKEYLFQQRLADLRSRNAQFPWTMGEAAQFDLPQEESKLFAERDLDRSVSIEEIERTALLDLTSLSNNFRTFYRRLHYELRRARRYTRPLSLLLVAIDGLERIGVDGGLEAKGKAVESTARILLSCIRDVDVAGRCREDTFGVILPETPRAGAEIAAERIRTKLEDFNVVYEWHNYQITASVGASCYPGHSTETEELFADAVEVLLSTMKSGGNSVVFAES